MNLLDLNSANFVKGNQGFFSPASFGSSRMPLWLKGVGSTVFHDDGIIFPFPPASDGQNIARWEDLSGNGNHVTQSTDAARPIWRLTGGPNGKGAVEMNGSSMFFNVPNVFSGLTSGEVFIVIKIDTDPPTAVASGIWKFGTETLFDDHYPFEDGTIYMGWGTNLRKTTVNPTPALTSWRLYNVKSTSTEYTTWLDGTELSTTGTNTVAFTTAPLLGKTATGGSFLDGVIAEMLIVDSITALEKIALKVYFAREYSLTLA